MFLFRKNRKPGSAHDGAQRNTSSQRLSMLSAKLWLLLAALEVARAPFEHAPLDGIVKHPDVKIGKGHGKGHGKKQKLEGPGSGRRCRSGIAGAIFHKRKVALVTGITGQDGSYLAELLLAKGCACFALHSSLRMRFIFYSHVLASILRHGARHRPSHELVQHEAHHRPQHAEPLPPLWRPHRRDVVPSDRN